MKKRADAESRVRELEANIDRLQNERSALLSSGLPDGGDLEAAGDASLDDAANKHAKRNRCSLFLAKMHMFVLWLCGKQSVS
jgi:hypothetical protein